MDRELLQSLYRYCLCLTASNAQAEDLLQTAIESWLKASSRPVQLRAYLRKVIRNQFIDDCRRLKLVDFEPLDDNAPALLDEACLEEIEIQHNLIEHLFELLNSAEREVLYLWAIEGYSAAEIAQELQQPRGTILSRLHRIKLKAAALVLNSSAQNIGGQ
ncbi:RNA polymerase, sigma-24 subunit, ECF subfamily [Shewanella halifaxensis HAW-EB4]|uniref:RNA polymerase, sigma-24 subunit, ECF subfamily n=1 Tax=Shewanella halifaxensis (strain HAW-EB4) TaxID=458817 RepID=B0TNK4_SHEHH|nr:sigma-70 family RNA polymerase sigma factor [Shewanella halifaxensis]ABZ78736.1 RNA polymerase, sigma-24 subunit, ECF subfamily [Shewanella halifaxensis HAW-EB4]